MLNIKENKNDLKIIVDFITDQPIYRYSPITHYSQMGEN